MFYEQLTKLCAQSHISLTTLVTKELHMSVSNVTKWKNGNVPKSDTVQKVATYFGVSTDYLLGNEQKNKPAAISDELGPKGKAIWERLQKIEAISEDDYNLAVAQLDLILNRPKRQDK